MYITNLFCNFLTFAMQDDGHSPWLHFAQGVTSGLYKGQDVFLGMVEGMLKKTEWAAAGKALNNMKWPIAFNQVCNMLGSLSPRLYRTFQHHFGGLKIRSMRYE